MRLAKNAFLTTLVMLALLVTVSAQTLRSEGDPRNIAPTVGTGGPPGGPTGLFTVYDGQTLRRGEFTFSIAYSNFDRDPGDVDIVEVPVSFQIGLSDHLELFFNTDAYRQLKVNSPRNLSSFYLPNSRINGISPAAIVACPRGTGTPLVVGACYRPAGTQPFSLFPYVGQSTGNFGFQFFQGNTLQIGTIFGFAANATPTIGPFQGDGGNSADFFPGIGSIYGSILPGIVLATTPAGVVAPGGGGATNPQVYTVQPSYLPDAPFINRTFGTSAFSTFSVGAKIRFTDPDNPTGFGIIPFYRFYADQAEDNFNMLQRGASPGGGGWNPFSNRGDIGLMVFLDSRLRKWVNLAGNAGYIWNSSVKAEIGGNEFTLLDRPDEFTYAVGLDFPVNKYFQPILEFRQTMYVGGRTPNAFENDPMDGIAGARIFPARWWGIGLAYRHHFNQQDRGSIDEVRFNQNVATRLTVLNAQNNVVNFTPGPTVNSTGSINSAFRASNDPHGFIFQFFAGHRNARGAENILNQAANVTALDLDRTSIVLPCPPGTQSRGGACGDVQTVGVKTTAVDPEGDVLTYSYTVSGGRITGQGANVSWDLTGVRPGTYTITSAVDDGCGFCGTPKTSTITVTECTDCFTPEPECTCPTVSVSASPQSVEPGNPITFTANVSGGSQNSVTYNWTVSQGSIESGQGTPVITVSTAGLSNTSITATVEIAISPTCATCTNFTASETASVTERPVPIAVEESSGAENRDQIRARVDNFITALQNSPGSRGIIFLYGTDREVKTREAQLREAFQFRGYPTDNIEFRRGGSEPGIRMRFFVVPTGADDPTP